MNEEQFWKIIEDSRAGTGHSQKAQEAKLKTLLSALDASEVAAFRRTLDRTLISSYTWDLWGAAYVLNGGCSDDGFEYFRRGLIASGQKRFQAAMHDPESIGDWAEADEVEFEGLTYIVDEVYEEKTKEVLDSGLRYPSEPAGEPWEEDQLDRRFPRLWEQVNG